ncbi:MAG: UvrD-helicase domain-containing protein [Alicyclobacillus sp.]|nr:UvrD-helicase domain-containing protein [Alicyclobacillus sp.]
MFTNEQANLIQSPPKDCVVFAAPGSGKTSVLTMHLAYNLQCGKLRPADIMAITFTRQAASDMKRRFQTAISMPASALEAMQIGTFHAQVFRLMLQIRPDIPLILSPTEQVAIMREALSRWRTPSLDDIRRHLNAATISKSAWPPRTMSKSLQQRLNAYEQLKRRLNRWDFDDILIAFCHALERKSTFDRIPMSARYLLVDEFQDTNAIQWHMVNTISRRYSLPLFVVGDEDQAIYGFRGASPEWLIRFPRHRPNAQVSWLSNNFRSDQRIVEHAQHLIEHNALRANKVVRCVSGRAGVCIGWSANEEVDEAHDVVRTLRQIRAQDANWTIGILARTRRQLSAIGSVLQGADRERTELRTFHDAKGKEWDVVFVIGAVCKNPYMIQSLHNQVDVEEERRLFYVALTRARHMSFVSWPRRIRKIRQSPARFIVEAGIPVVPHADLSQCVLGFWDEPHPQFTN